MSVKLAQRWVDQTFTHNKDTAGFFKRCVVAHVVLSVVVGALALTVNASLGWIEVYALPVTIGCMRELVLTVRGNADILDKANATLDKVNSQLLIKQRILELREAAKQRSK